LVNLCLDNWHSDIAKKIIFDIVNMHTTNLSIVAMFMSYFTLAPTGPPRDVTLMDTDPAMLSVRYRSPEVSLRNGDVTGYVIRYTRVDSGESFNITVDGGSSGGLRTSVIPGLVAFTRYSVEVAFVNANGTGPFSDPMTGLSGQGSEFILLAQ